MTCDSFPELPGDSWGKSVCWCALPKWNIVVNPNDNWNVFWWEASVITQQAAQVYMFRPPSER